MDEGPRASDYGVLERDQLQGEIGVHAERIRVAGYSVVADAFTTEQTAQLASRLDAVLERQTAEFGGAARMDAIGDAGTARCLLAYDDAFLEAAAHPAILALCRMLLGQYIVLMQQNGVSNPSVEAHPQARYHRDLPYQHFTSSRPLAISALLCLDPFTPETGATTLIPGSHRLERFPSDEVAAALDSVADARAGSYIVFDSMLFHRAGRNRSGRPRRGINHVFSIPLIAQQISIPAALQGRFSDDPALAQLLGYGAAAPASVMAWRERRLARLTQSR
jgi:ectoine hydroxylase-related dioxygenase (phytanoyl-CoA dioxygenase family)